jgi:branched-chain amino acid transport system ATP-binding protein
MKEVLKLENLEFHYGAIHALHGISLEVKEGEIVALIGANGAGKTTTLRCISGLLPHRSHGKIFFYGENIANKRAERIAAEGITHVLEGRHIFSTLTVKENLVLGSFGRDQNLKTSLDYIYDLFPRLKEREKQEGGTLSGGEQQMLAVGRALMSKPKLLMLDEPSLGLAPILVKEIFEIIKKINNKGTPILIVEQNSKAALHVADRAYVLEIGQIVLAGKSDSLMHNEEVRKSYLGEE